MEAAPKGGMPMPMMPPAKKSKGSYSRGYYAGGQDLMESGIETNLGSFLGGISGQERDLMNEQDEHENKTVLRMREVKDKKSKMTKDFEKVKKNDLMKGKTKIAKVLKVHKSGESLSKKKERKDESEEEESKDDDDSFSNSGFGQSLPIGSYG